VVLLEVRRREDGRVAAPVLAQRVLGNVDGVLVLGVLGDVLENVHRLERLGEGAAPLAEHPVALLADAPRVLAPQVGEHVPHRAGHVVAVLPVLVERLDADAVRVEDDELAHPAHHLLDPPPHVPLRPLGERAVEGEDEVRVPGEPHVRRIAGERRQRGHQLLRRRRAVEAREQAVEERRLVVGGKDGLVLDRVGDAAEEVRAQHRAPERAGEDADAQGEGARDGGEDVEAEALGLAPSDRSSRCLQSDVHRAAPLRVSSGSPPVGPHGR
jgi:hypothetical protein